MAKNSKSKRQEVQKAGKKIENTKNVLDAPAAREVTSPESPAPQAPAATQATETSGAQKTMAELTFNRSDKERKSISVVYTADGYPGSVRFSKTLFKDKQAPPSITVNSDAFAGPKVKETKEERKARLKALPKLTDAQKLQKIEEKAARLREKLAKGNTAGAAA